MPLLNYGVLMIPSTVDWIEVVWTLAALPGIWVWTVNRISAGKTLRAARKMGFTNGRLLWAKYSTLKSDCLLAISLVFVLIGIISMSRPNSTIGWDWLRVLLTIGLLGAPAIISFLGIKWRAVDQYILKTAREHRRHPHDGTI